MLIRCPHCGHRIEVKNAKPRSYSMTCSKCRAGFGMYIEGKPENPRIGVFNTVEEMQQRLLQALAIKRARRRQLSEEGDGGGDAGGDIVPTQADRDEVAKEFMATLVTPGGASGGAGPEGEASEVDFAGRSDEDRDEAVEARPESPTAHLAPLAHRSERPDSPLGSAEPVAASSGDSTADIDLGLGSRDDDVQAALVTPAVRPETPPRPQRPAAPTSGDADVTLAGPRPGGQAAVPMAPSGPPRPVAGQPTAPVTIYGASKGASSTRPPAGSDATLPGGSARPPRGEVDATLASPARSSAPADADATLAGPAKSRGKKSVDDEPTIFSDFNDESAVHEAPRDADATVAASRPPAATYPAHREIMPIEALEEISGRLGGYQIIKLLGQGGMGCVYLAQQLSLDRRVAVKTMNPEWAQDPVFLSRFTREAYAAAQLVNHHIVQIYDIGEDRKVHFFSMEFVAGRSLQDLVEEKGRLDPEEAAGYILQAARGLKFAHDHGMIHRDIKPDNLMLNEQGVVKVADLGLVKTPAAAQEDEKAEAAAAAQSKSDVGKSRATPRASISATASASVTVADVAMGTPAYMAPEQAKDARSVDVRADIYSLGCTLYTLVTGKPIFEGKTIYEVMSKHQTEPVVPPEIVVSRVPKMLSAVIMKMVAKDPADRYPDMGAVIAALEDFLGVSSSGPFTPREEHARVLEDAVADYNDAEMGRVRSLGMLLFTSLCGALVICFGLFRWTLPAGGALGLFVLTALAYAMTSGILRKSYLASKFRSLIFGARLTDWMTWSAGGAVVLVLLWAFGLLWLWLGLCLVALVLGGGYHLVIDRLLARQRRQPITAVQELLKAMRLRGLEEEALRRFVCRYSGDNWEPFYEELFGYEDKITARQKWGRGDSGKPRRRYGVWRDMLVHWIDHKLKQREMDKQRRYLAKIERAKLKANGASDAEAARKAQSAAEQLVTMASQFRAQVNAVDKTAVGEPLPAGVQAKPLNVNKVIYGDEDESGERQVPRGGLRIIGLGNLLFGSRMRFLVGALLLAVCGLWLAQNKAFSSDLKSLTNIENLEQAQQIAASAKTYKPLSLPWVPVPATLLDILSSPGSGIAGLILVVSSIFHGIRLSVFLVPGVAFTLLADWLDVPVLKNLKIGPLHGDYLLWAVGAGLCIVGWFFGRQRD